MKCSRCHAIRYCSRACQRADWKRHKPECQDAACHRDKQAHRGAAAEEEEGAREPEGLQGNEEAQDAAAEPEEHLAAISN